MKHSYEGEQSSRIINKFQTSDDKIVITYLDGTCKDIPFSEEDKSNILNQMISQASVRNEKSIIKNNIISRSRMLAIIIIDMLVMFFLIGQSNNYEYPSIRPFFSWLSGIIGIKIIVSGISYKFQNDEVQELQKYAIYLAMREKLDVNINNPTIFSGIKNKKSLDINTLDSYTLKEIKQIQMNLDHLLGKNPEKKSLFTRLRQKKKK